MTSQASSTLHNKEKPSEEETVNSFLCYKTTHRNFFIFFSCFNLLWTFSAVCLFCALFYRSPKFHLETILFLIASVFFGLNLASFWRFIKDQNYGLKIHKICAINGIIISSLLAAVLGLVLMFIVIGSIIIPGKDKIGKYSVLWVY